MSTPRLTPQTQVVLTVLVTRETWGFELSKDSGLPAGTIYPILQRLTAAGWVTSRWEDVEPARAQGRPPRRYYALTTEGRARAVHALAASADRRASLSRLLAGEGT